MPAVQIRLEKVLRCLNKKRNEKKVKEEEGEKQEGRKAGSGWVVFKKCSQRGHGNQEHNTWLPLLRLPPTLGKLGHENFSEAVFLKNHGSYSAV